MNGNKCLQFVRQNYWSAISGLPIAWQIAGGADRPKASVALEEVQLLVLYMDNDHYKLQQPIAIVCSDLAA